MAAIKDYLNSLIWAKDNLNILPGQNAVNQAVKSGNSLKSLKWLKDTGVPNVFLPTQKGVNFAAQYARLDVLIWIKENIDIVSNQTGINKMLEEMTDIS